MSFLQSVLDRLLPGTAPWQPDERNMFVLSVLPDTIVNLAESADGSLIHFYSPCGYAIAGQPIQVRLPPDADGRQAGRILVAAENGLCVSLLSAERNGLDELSFARKLGEHVNFSRALAAALPPPDEDAAPPLLGDATWIECERAA